MSYLAFFLPSSTIPPENCNLYISTGSVHMYYVITIKSKGDNKIEMFAVISISASDIYIIITHWYGCPTPSCGTVVSFVKQSKHFTCIPKRCGQVQR